MEEGLDISGAGFRQQLDRRLCVLGVAQTPGLVSDWRDRAYYDHCKDDQGGTGEPAYVAVVRGSAVFPAVRGGVLAAGIVLVSPEDFHQGLGREKIIAR